jgi:hypothetical protein
MKFYDNDEILAYEHKHNRRWTPAQQDSAKAAVHLRTRAIQDLGSSVQTEGEEWVYIHARGLNFLSWKGHQSSFLVRCNDTMNVLPRLEG